MKRLLRLLLLFTVVAPLPANVIACGKPDGETSQETHPVDVAKLLTTAKQNINTFFNEDLIAKNKNILFPNTFTNINGEQLLADISAHGNSDITEQQLKDPFLAVIKDNIKFFGEKLADDENLKSLFYGINTSDILQLSANDTILTKNKFDEWKNDNAFYDGYKKEAYNLEQLNSLTFDLHFTLNYKNNDNIIANYIFIQKYNIYFANNDANVVGLIKAASDQPTRPLNDYLAELTINDDFGGQELNLNDYGDETKIYEAIKNKVVTKISNENVKINRAAIPYSLGNTFNKFGSAYHSWFNIGQYRNQTAAVVESDFRTQISGNEKTFTNKLDAWKDNKLIGNAVAQNKIILFGQLQISEWQYNGLDLNLRDVPFIIIGNETLTKRFDNAAKQVGQLFSADTILKPGLEMDSSNKSLTMKMNEADFKIYKNSNKTFGDTMTYLKTKIEAKAKAENILSANEYFNIINRQPTSKNFSTIRVKDHIVNDNSFVLKNIANASTSCHMDFDVGSFILFDAYFANWTVNSADFWD